MVRGRTLCPFALPSGGSLSGLILCMLSRSLLSLYVCQSSCVWKTLYPLPLALTVFLPLLLHISLGFEGRRGFDEDITCRAEGQAHMYKP